jgi:hypothetical protein
MVLAGLGIDAWLHAQDPTLAEREGIFAISNPGHVLLGAGIALACGGLLFALYSACGMPAAPALVRGRVMRLAVLQAGLLGSVAAVIFALSVSAEGHEHGAEPDSAHVHSETSGATDVALLSGTSGGSEALLKESVPSGAHTHMAPPPSAPPSATFGASDTAGQGHSHADLPPDAAAGAVMAEGNRPVHEHPIASADEQACLAALTEEVRAAATQYADYGVAVANGYREPKRAGGTHYGNPAYHRDGLVLEASKPETLIYRTRADASKLLVGVMFSVAKGQHGPTPCGNATYWHTHTTCWSGREEVSEIEEGVCPGTVPRVSGEMMHIWFYPRDGKRAA